MRIARAIQRADVRTKRIAEINKGGFGDDVFFCDSFTRFRNQCKRTTDRTARNGDVCNKIGTYLKALAAFDNKVPFYVALPGPTIDWQMSDGVNGIPIEQRDGYEVTHVAGKNSAGKIESVQLTPDGVTACNYAFDVTPARLVTGLFTERGVCDASEAGLLGLYPEQRGSL